MLELRTGKPEVDWQMSQLWTVEYIQGNSCIQ